MKIDNRTAAKLLRVLLETVEAQQDDIDVLSQMVKDFEAEKAAKTEESKPGRAYKKSEVA